MTTALLADPSRTAPIARRVNSGLQSQFDQLNAAIYYMLVNRDTLGLNIPSWQNPINFPMEYSNQPLGFASSNSVPLGFKHNGRIGPTGYPTVNTDWAYLTDAQKLAQFKLAHNEITTNHFWDDELRDWHGRWSSSVGSKFALRDNPEAVIRMQKMLGDVNLGKLGDLAGAPPNSAFAVYLDRPASERIYVHTVVPELEYGSWREIIPRDKHIYNAGQTLGEAHRGKGVGTRAFVHQVHHAINNGYASIGMEASGNLVDPYNNGYYTWGRLGVDAPIGSVEDRKVQQLVKYEYPGAKKISDILHSPGGVSWWKSNGSSFSGTFDLRRNSHSRKILAHYLREKRALKIAEAIATGAKALGRLGLKNAPKLLTLLEAYDPTAEDEACLDRAWTAVANGSTYGEILDEDCHQPTLVANTDWKYLSDAEKLAQFKLWLDNKTLHITGDTSKEWLTNYIKQAYDKGVSRSYDDVNRVDRSIAHAHRVIKKSKSSKILAKYRQADVNKLDLYNGGKSSFLRSSFGHPVSTARVELLAARAHNELQGVTEAMKQQLGRALVEGMIRGDNPKKLARTLQKTVKDVGKRRANALAHTEIVRAHAHGQLDALKALGVTHVGAKVEFETSGLPNVCPKCKHLNHVVIPIDEAYSIIPVHPICHCAWVPADVGESRKGQVRSKSRIRRKLTLAGVN